MGISIKKFIDEGKTNKISVLDVMDKNEAYTTKELSDKLSKKEGRMISPQNTRHRLIRAKNKKFVENRFLDGIQYWVRL